MTDNASAVDTLIRIKPTKALFFQYGCQTNQSIL